MSYLTYWVDEAAGKIFCLVEAPDAEAAHPVHREAHGLVADEIYLVEPGPQHTERLVAGEPGGRQDRAVDPRQAGPRDRRRVHGTASAAVDDFLRRL